MQRWNKRMFSLPASGPEPIRSSFADDPDFRELLLEFTAALAERREGMLSAYRAGAHDKLRSQAHQLKGSGGGYGFRELSELAAELELACQVQDPARLAEKLEAIVGYLNRITI
jgi:HPt (histidine-containing phosphotransfer) domain-containing protein